MMLKRLLSYFLVFGVVFYLCNPVFAKTTEEEIKELKAKMIQLEKRLAQVGNRTIELEKITDGAERKIGEFNEYKPNEKDEKKLAGLTISAGATFIMQVNELTENSVDVTDASYSMDLEIEKTFEDYGLAFLHLETGDGTGIEDELQVFSYVNRDADDSDNSVSITEAWYEHYFKVLPLTLTFGKIDATAYLDTNEYANDETTQFLGHIFRNSPVVEFPDDNAFGVRVAIEPADFLGIEFLAMDADANWEDAFDNMFLSVQFNFKPKVFKTSANYRIYGWINNKNHTKWADNTQKTKEEYGFGLSFDQEITDIFGFFVRYGWQDPEVYVDGSDFSINQSWSTGIQIAGDLWGREDNVFAIAFGQVTPSENYKKTNNLKANTESHLEAYYNFKVNDNLCVSPNIQVIWEPYGGDSVNGDRPILVGGVRSQVDF